MTTRDSMTDDALVRQLIEAREASMRAMTEFFAEGVDRVRLIRAMLMGRGRSAAIWTIPYLKESEQKNLFPELLLHASYAHGSVEFFRDAILSLPREWVLGRIEEAAEPLLRDGTYDEYRRLLELYSLLDRDLTLKLARRAAASPDEDVREAGAEYLDAFGPSGNPPGANGGEAGRQPHPESVDSGNKGF